MFRVYVIDDDEAVRSALKLLVESVGYAVEAFPSGAAFLDHDTELEKACLILDVHMPGVNGLDLMDELRQRGKLPPTIVLTGNADVPMAVRAMKQGVLDFLEKPFRDQALIDLIERAASRVARTRKEDAERDLIERAFATLSAREQEVLDYLVKGCANKVIAIEMGISERTVEIHRGNVMHKTGARSVAELVRCYLALNDGD